MNSHNTPTCNCTLKGSMRLHFLPLLWTASDAKNNVTWNFSNSIKPDKFMDTVELHLRELVLRVTGLWRLLLRCTGAIHEICFTKACDAINKTLIRCGQRIFCTIIYHLAPGSNKYVRIHYSNYSSAFHESWLQGSQWQGVLASWMRQLRVRFKLGLHRCRQQEEIVRNQAAAEKLVLKNIPGF